MSSLKIGSVKPIKPSAVVVKRQQRWTVAPVQMSEVWNAADAVTECSTSNCTELVRGWVKKFLDRCDKGVWFSQLKRFSHFSQSYPTVLTRLYYYCTFFKSDLSSTKNKGITVLPNFDLKKKIILTEACNRFGSSQDSTNYFLIKKKQNWQKCSNRGKSI